MIFTASLLGAWHVGKVVENKPANSLVMSLGKAPNEKPPPLCGRQVPQFSPPKRGLMAGRASDHKTNTMLKKCRLSTVAIPNREKSKDKEQEVVMIPFPYLIYLVYC